MTPQERPRLGFIGAAARCGLIASFVVVLSQPAWAARQAKTDVVTLVNGDTITCEIKLLDKGRLEVSTDNVGDVSIKWEKVASVKASRTFQVETSNGIRVLGELTAAAAGELNVTTTVGAVPLTLASVVYIAAIGSGFWKRLDGSFNTGVSYTQSSGVAQLNLTTDVSYRRPSLNMSLTASSYFTHQPDVADTSRHSIQFSRSRLVGKQWLWFAQGGFERNEDLGYALRSTVSAGAGKYLVRSNRAVFALGGGLSTNQERPVDGTPVQNLDGYGSIRQSFFTYDFPKTDLSFTADLYPGLSNWGRFRAELNGSIRREIVRDFTIGVTAYDSYDNRPPTAEARTNDVGFSFTIGWTF